MSLQPRRILSVAALLVACCVCVCLSVAQPAAPPANDKIPAGVATQGLVAYYNFDEGSGDVLRDVTGKGSNGKINGATFVKMSKGFALKFDGEDDHVDCGHPDALDPAFDTTVEFWMRAVEVPKNGEPGVVGKTPFRYGMTYYTNGHCFWYISGGDNSIKTPLAPKEWHHVVGTFDTLEMRMYIDGKLVGSRESKYEVITQGKHFYIGRATRPSGIFSGYFKGMVDEVRVYDRALSPDEVKKNYEATRSLFLPAAATRADG